MLHRDAPSKGKSRPLSSVLEGQVVLVQVSDLSLTRKVLPDLATWTQCFARYVSVISTHQPQRVPDLMAYMSLIIKASQKLPISIMDHVRPKFPSAGSRSRKY